MTTKTLQWLALVLALTACACADDPQVTTPTPTTPTSPVTESFTSGIVPMGSSSKTFVAAISGTVTLTLKSSGPPTNVALGIGVGIPPTSGTATCSLTTAVTTDPTVAAPQLSIAVDAGLYCVKVFDVGSLTQQAFFDLTIVRP